MDYIRGHSNGFTGMDHIAHTRFLFSTLAAVGLGGAAVGAAAAHPKVQQHFKDGADWVGKAPQGIADLHRKHMDWHHNNIRIATPILGALGKIGAVVPGAILGGLNAHITKSSHANQGFHNLFGSFRDR